MARFFLIQVKITMARRWNEGEVTEITWLSKNTIQIKVKAPVGISFDFVPGQFITLDLPTGEKRLDRWRSYSIASNGLDDSGCFELCIVKFPGGKASAYLFEELKIGDKLIYKGPEGQFVLPSIPEPTKLVMVCTGTGVAPFRSMIQAIYQKVDRLQPVHLIFGCRYEEDILYREEFEKLTEQRPDFSYSIALSREVGWSGTKGYVHQVYETSYSQNDSVVFMLCGWTPMVEEARKRLKGLGFEDHQIRTEIYG